ncbi:MAG: hypothetical protein SW833_17585 [Cyanobacteriota bacterium]|nr:hypothetical protein [Cyanobacteriota bacterium]
MKKILTAIVLSGIMWLMGIAVAPTALASVPIKLTNLSARECTSDSLEGVVSSGGGSIPSNCFIVSGKAKNPSGKTLVDADVFGRIYDANGEPVFQNRGRVGALPEVPPGVSDFEIRITVSGNQPAPLQLKQFKAAGFTHRVRPFYYDD